MSTQKAVSISSSVPLVVVLILLSGCFNGKVQTTATSERPFQHEETRDLVALVTDAAELVRTKGEAAFSEFRIPGSRWRRGESYIFVLDPEGNMPVRPDPDL